jgi:Zn-dependent protease
MSELTNERQTEIERKLQEEEILKRSAAPPQQAQNTPQAPSSWPANGGQQWQPQQYAQGQQPPTFIEPPGGYTPYVPEQPVQQPGLLERWKAKGGILGVLASILMFLVKVGAPLLYFLSKLKFLAIGLKLILMLGSMAVSMWAWSTVYGWKMGVGIVGLIFVHECGHALAAKLRGIPTGIMVFIPLMGAFVTTNRYGKNLEEDAFIGIMGPVVGSAASLVCFLLYFATGSPFWMVLGLFGFFMNLFNLLPTAPLDGGWIVPLFSPKLLAIGAVIAVVVGFSNHLIWILAVASMPRIISGWKADPATQPYYRVSAAARWKYGAAYLGLATVLAIAVSLSHNLLKSVVVQ